MNSSVLKRRVAVITDNDSDMLFLLRTIDQDLLVIKPKDAATVEWNDFDSIAILGGAADKPLILPPSARVKIEQAYNSGKRVFAEFVGSVGDLYFELPASTRYARLVVAKQDWLADEPVGALIDDQCGERLRPHEFTYAKVKPLLYYSVSQAHGKIEPNDMNEQDMIRERALWFEAEEQLLVCAFRLANFSKARHAPLSRTQKLVSFIINWLYGFEISNQIEQFPRHYKTHIISTDEVTPIAIRSSAKHALNWVKQTNILIDDGRGGALEGLGTEIDYNGQQRISPVLRADCIGELGLLFWLHSIAEDDPYSDSVSHHLSDYILDYYVNKEPGPLYGMMRWTDEAWGVCYQDDVARAILPRLLRSYYEQTTNRIDECSDILNFLLSTTGTDGTRKSRTDNNLLTPDELHKLQTTPGDTPSAHYNAYYYAALCIAYQLNKREDYKAAAIKGLSAIMSVYPNTKREQSQTQELCRLILPLAWLYEITKEEQHLQWLYQVSHDLQAFVHPSGAYIEWDEGYGAAMRHEGGSGESSLLGRNGDPVTDQLYSNNWLPIGWMQAYFITGDDWFKERWTETVRFMLSSQIHSVDPMIDGCWTRAFDVELMEVYGNPADVGWGPWAVESGWTVAEIASGLYMGLLEEKLKSVHQRQR
ncbi:hypothetical protein ACP8HI_18380 [Paenibacillus sp. FA6]|uniref:hypothetical protein n=1 Tax=Paenibacillus sp. FA6 TaxID=3413029 RepID=UPI003F65F7E5